jgi:hypothetical protein
LVNAAVGETIVIDIFSALLGIASIFVMFRAVTKVIIRPPKVWDEEEVWTNDEMEELSDYNEIRKQNPHIWIQ